MAVAGLVRLRKHQFTRQAVMNTKQAPTRAYPFKGVPDVDLEWTDPDIDAGSLDPVAAPYRGAGAFTAPLTMPSLAYDDLPLLLSGFFGGQVAPTGGGPDVTWQYQPASATLDPIDPFTYEFGDDVAGDWYQLGDGILESVEITGPEGLGVLTASANWRFGSAASGSSTETQPNPAITTGLAVDLAPALVYLKDGLIKIGSTVGGMAQVSDALHTFTLRLGGELDMKRWANGDQTFDIDAYARSTRTIELELTFSKTSDTVGTGSESDAWFSDIAVQRFVQMVFTSTVEADTGTFYSWEFTMPMRYYTRVESEIGGNSVIVLTGHANYDPVDYVGVFDTTIVNTLAEADLGLAGS